MVISMKKLYFKLPNMNIIEITPCINYTITNKETGNKKRKYVVAEQKSGFDYSHKLNKQVLRETEINRRKDYYREEVLDYDNNEQIHFCEERLSKHYGHGSAKFKNK